MILELIGRASCTLVLYYVGARAFGVPFKLWREASIALLLSAAFIAIKW